MISASDRIQVCARFRPPNAQELASSEEGGGDGDNDALCVDFVGGDGMRARVRNPHARSSTDFTFHSMLPPATSQNACYRAVAKPLVDAVLDGCNAACIAYGQTGSGKTHTMFGPGFDESRRAGSRQKEGGFVWDCDPADYGIIPRLFEDLFARVRLNADRVQCEVECSFVQLYQETPRDLITGLKLRVRQNYEGVFTTNALLSPVESTGDLLALVQEGLANRVTAATLQNVSSSRSHAILTTKIIQRDLDTGEMRLSTLDLVDLAGSEKILKTGATGHRIKEAGSINQSLLVLSRVIEQLSKAERTKSKLKAKAIERFVPYRESVLSKLLKNTLGGNSVTTLLICASPHSYNIAETLRALHFGSNAKSIQNTPVKHIVLNPEQLRGAIQRATRTLEEQRVEIQQRQRELLLHRRLVQEVLSRVPAGSVELQSIFAVLPTLRSLPRVKKWGTIYIPEWLMFEIYAFSGVAGMLKSVMVSKEWRDTLYEKKWDVLLWKAVYLREAERWWYVHEGRGVAAGGDGSDTIPVASEVVPVATGRRKGAASKTPVASSVATCAPAGEEKKTAAAGRKKIDGSRWRTTAANWFSGKEAKRLRELRKLFRDKEREKLGGAGQNDTLILLR